MFIPFIAHSCIFMLFKTFGEDIDLHTVPVYIINCMHNNFFIVPKICPEN